MQKKDISTIGFTIIELLLVVAIIGILSSVTYASLGGAREKARDTSIASNMQGILIEANLYHSKYDTYTDFCIDTTTDIDELLAKIGTESPSTPTCSDQDDEYGVIVELHSGKYYCVDSSKAFGEYANSNLVSNQCP